MNPQMNITALSSQTLAAQNLECIRAGRRVFSGLFFHLRGGFMLHLRGANGAGKTSLLRMIAGLLPIASGTLTAVPPFHYIGHANALSPSLSVQDTLRFWERLMRYESPSLYSHFSVGSVEDSLDQWNLRHAAFLPVSLLSAGQARALSLCRLRLAPRPLWLLDEPATSLDSRRREILHAQICDHLNQGGMIILADHMGEAILIKDKIIDLDMDAL